MIHWNRIRLAKGERYSTRLGPYGIALYEDPRGTIIWSLGTVADDQPRSIAHGEAADLSDAKRCALDALIDYILGDARRHLLDLLTIPEEANGTQTDL